MSLVRAVFWNTSVQIAGRAVSTALGLVVLAIMTRSLGPDGFGGYITIISFLQFFGIIVDFGLTLTANRALGEEKSEEANSVFMSNLMTLRLFSALVFLGLAPFVALFFFPYPPEVKQGIFLVVVSFLAIILVQTMVPIFQKKLQMGKVVLSEIFGRLVLLVGVALCAWLNLGLFWIMGAIVLGSVANYSLLYFFTAQIFHLRWSFDFIIWRRVIAMSWPIGISIIFNLVYLKADTIFLSVMRSQTEVGLYGAAYRVLDILTGLAAMFMGLIMPLMAAAWASGDQARFKHLLQRAFDAMSFIALPTIAIGVLLGRPLMSLVAGREFLFSGDILAILIIAMGAVFFSTVFGYAVVVVNKQKLMIWGYALDAVLSLVGYLIFIPKYGVWGAAWVTVFSEALIVILTFIVVARTSHAVPSLRIFGKAVLAVLVGSLMMFLVREFNWFLAGLLGIAAYGIMLFLTKAVSKKTVQEILSLKRN